MHTVVSTAIVSAEQISGSRKTGSMRMNISGFLSMFLNLLKRWQHYFLPPVGDGTSLTFVFSFVPDADPTPSLEHHSHLGQQTSHIDEGAEFPTRKKNDSIFQ